MKWKSEWLARLILTEIEHEWKQAQRDGEGRFGPACDYFVVQERDAGLQPFKNYDPGGREEDLLQAYFVGPPLRRWKFDSSGLRDRKEFEGEDHTVRGMFFVGGIVSFKVSEDRKHVVLEFSLGPRCSRQRVYRVQGQGTRGSLEGHPDFAGWKS